MLIKMPKNLLKVYKGLIEEEKVNFFDVMTLAVENNDNNLFKLLSVDEIRIDKFKKSFNDLVLGLSFLFTEEHIDFYSFFSEYETVVYNNEGTEDESSEIITDPSQEEKTEKINAYLKKLEKINLILLRESDYEKLLVKLHEQSSIFQDHTIDFFRDHMFSSNLFFAYIIKYNKQTVESYL